MNINRLNYEEFFLLYVDNELNIAQRRAVETFIEQNPDLKAELLMLQDSVLPIDEEVVFDNKASLLKMAGGPNPVNDSNCEEYFVLYADDELNNQLKDNVEQFVYRNPQHQVSFEAMQKAKLMPDMAITFPNKFALYRKEEDDKVVPFFRVRFARIAVAAAVLLFVGGMSWYLSSSNDVTSDPNGTVASNDTNRTQPAHTAPVQEGIAHQDNPAQQQDKNALQNNKTATSDNKAAAFSNKNLAATDQHTPDRNTPAVKNRIITNNDVKNTDVADAQKQTQKIIADPRNISVPQHVQLIKNDVAVANNETPKVNGTATGNTPKLVVPATGDQNNKNADLAMNDNSKIPDMKVTPEDEADHDPIYASNTSSNKKNKMRGFFRKVSRVFEKTANIDGDGNERSAIRIANFEIALK